MIVQTVNLSSWLILNALLPEALPNVVREQYTDRFVSWQPTRTDDTAMLLQALRELRYLNGTRSCLSELRFAIRSCFRDFVGSLYRQEFNDEQLGPIAELCVTIRLKCLTRVVDRTAQGSNSYNAHTMLGSVSIGAAKCR